jgi:pimeloyl-ACP methyl ester carboxylesterase
VTGGLRGLLAVAVLCLPPAADADPGAAVATEAFRTAARDHAQSAADGALQPGCATVFLPATGPRRGAVLALHGFGGCPQQFAGLAPRLAAAGFDVLVPRLPGHGRQPLAGGREDLTDVPAGADGAARYAAFLATLDALLARSPGERVLVGFSAGGGLALQAVAAAPGRYARLVLLAPLVGIRGGSAVEWLAWQLGRAPGLAALDVKHFGPRRDCATWQAAGRGGFCGYELRHAAALVGLVRAVRADWQDRPLPVRVGILLAGDERYVSNAAAGRFAARQQALGAPVSIGTLPGVPHEMLTPFENVGRDMTWLGGLEAAVLAAVAGDP